jgi:hypothetical protein
MGTPTSILVGGIVAATFGLIFWRLNQPHKPSHQAQSAHARAVERESYWYSRPDHENIEKVPLEDPPS